MSLLYSLLPVSTGVLSEVPRHVAFYSSFGVSLTWFVVVRAGPVNLLSISFLPSIEECVPFNALLDLISLASILWEPNNQCGF